MQEWKSHADVMGAHACEDAAVITIVLLGVKCGISFKTSHSSALNEGAGPFAGNSASCEMNLNRPSRLSTCSVPTSMGDPD